MRVVMLDMGERKYGDATYCETGGKSILVDGAHHGDDRSSTRPTPSIPDQLKVITGKSAPFEFDLVVVTHCHSDHIGCLPELIRDGIITAKWALVADERMGFGIPLDEQFPANPKTSAERVAAALREEPLPVSATDHEIELLIDAAATLQERYATMLETLSSQGTCK